MKNKDEILKILNGLKGELATNYKVKSIGVFGSVIREEMKIVR